MEVVEERPAHAVPFVQTVQLGVDRIGYLLRVIAAGAAAGNPEQDRSVLADEMVPRRFASLCARAGKRQVVEVE